jgi:hypothetical protein
MLDLNRRGDWNFSGRIWRRRGFRCRLWFRQRLGFGRRRRLDVALELGDLFWGRELRELLLAFGRPGQRGPYLIELGGPALGLPARLRRGWRLTAR